MGDVFPQPWCGEKGKFFALLRAASLPLPIYGGLRSAKCQEWAPTLPGIPHPIPTFPQFFPFYPQIGGLYSLTLLPLDRLESRPTFIHYPSSPLSSVLCPDSFIRSPFVDGLPPQTEKPVLLSSALLDQPSARRLSPSVPRCPRSAPIRLFVPHLLTVSPQTEKPVLLSSALLGQPSARRLSPRRPCSARIRLFVPHSLTVSPRTEKPALLSSALLGQPFACRLSPRRPCSAPIRLFVPHSLTVSPQTEKPVLLSSALLDQPSARRLSPASPRGPRSAVCCPSFTPQSAARGSLFIVLSAVCRPRSAVYLIGSVSFLQEIRERK